MKEMIVGALLIIAGAVQPAQASPYTGKDFLIDCQQNRNRDSCISYVQQTVGAWWLAHSAGSRSEEYREALPLAAFCAPADSTPGQAVDTVVLYLMNYYEELSQDAGLVVVFALMDAWRCDLRIPG